MPERQDHEGPTEEFLTRCRARMNQIDALAPEVRALVHEHGWHIVNSFLTSGVKKASQIRNLIEVVHAGAAEYGNATRGGSRMADRDALDELARRRPDLAVVPREPSPDMVAASRRALETAHAHGMADWVGEDEKHRLRLRAAIQAGAVTARNPRG